MSLFRAEFKSPFTYSVINNTIRRATGHSHIQMFYIFRRSWEYFTTNLSTSDGTPSGPGAVLFLIELIALYSSCCLKNMTSFTSKLIWEDVPHFVSLHWARKRVPLLVYSGPVCIPIPKDLVSHPRTAHSNHLTLSDNFTRYLFAILYWSDLIAALSLTRSPSEFHAVAP